MQTFTPASYKFLSPREQARNHALKYIIPFIFGHGPDSDNYIFNSGTATLVDLGSGPLALTCEHVVTPFREFREANKDRINAELYIGGATGIDRKIIGWDKDLDIATLKLTKDELNKIPFSQNTCGTQCVNEVYTGPITENDVIVFAGFPSEPSWRYRTPNKLLSFHSCVCFAEIVSINDDYIICQSNFIKYESDTNPNITLTTDPTGMSGGAAFLILKRGMSISYHFIGIISIGKFLTDNCLTMYIRLAKRLNSDGTIKGAIA